MLHPHRPTWAASRRGLGAALSGLAVWASFPPLNWWPAAIVGTAGLTLVVRGTRRRHAAWCGWWFGLGLWLPTMSFLRDLAVEAWLAVAVLEALWFVALALALRRASRSRWELAAMPALWVLQEWARDRYPFGGFPWGRLAFGQVDGPLVRLAAWVGAPGVTAAVAGAGALGVYIFVDLSRHRRRSLIAAAGLAALIAGPLLITLPDAGTTTRGPASAVIAVVQGNVPRLGLDVYEQARVVTANHLAETRRLADLVREGHLPRPQAVVWPENASDYDPFDDLTARKTIDEAVAAIQVPILVGAVLDGPGVRHVRNAGLVWTPTQGPTEIYVKRHLVPFGEYVPLRGLVSHLSSRFQLVPNDFVAGNRPGLLHLGPVAVADTICFEVADDTVVRQAVTAGGRLLVVQTNNADYERQGDGGDGGETAQQLAIARLRAIEHGRAVVVAATTGVSALIAPNGNVLARTKVFQPAILDRAMPLRDPETVSDRLGPWPERVVAALAAVWLLLVPRRRLRRKAAEPQVEVLSRLTGARV